METQLEVFINSFVESFRQAWGLMDEIEKRRSIRQMLETINQGNGNEMPINDEFIEKILEKMNDTAQPQNNENNNENSNNAPLIDDGDDNLMSILEAMTSTMDETRVLGESNKKWEGQNTLWLSDEQQKKALEEFKKNYPKKEMIFHLPLGHQDFNELLRGEIAEIAKSRNAIIEESLDPISLLSKEGYGKLREDYAKKWVEEFNKQFEGDKVEIIDFNSEKNPLVRSMTNIQQDKFLEYVKEMNPSVTEAVCANKEWLSLDGLEIEGLGIIKSDTNIVEQTQTQEQTENIKTEEEIKGVEIVPQNIPENNIENIPTNIDGKGMNNDEKQDTEGIVNNISELMGEGKDAQQLQKEQYEKQFQNQTQDQTQTETPAPQTQTQTQSTQSEEIPINPNYPNLSLFVGQVRLKLKNNKEYSKADFKADFLKLCSSSNLNEKETDVLCALSRGTRLNGTQRDFIKEGYPLILENKNAELKRPIELLIKSHFVSTSKSEIEELKVYARTLHSKKETELSKAEQIILKDLQKGGFLEKTQTQTQTQQLDKKFNKNANKGRGMR